MTGYIPPYETTARVTYPIVFRNGKRVCWNCGRFRSPKYVCRYCHEHKDNRELHRFTISAAWQAVQIGLHKSEMVDHTTQHVPSPA